MRKSLLFAFIFLISTGHAFAAAQTGLAWENPLQTLVNSITGPVAYGFSVAGVVVAGSGFAMGGELQGFIKVCLTLTLAISFVLLATNVLARLYGVSGAIIP